MTWRIQKTLAFRSGNWYRLLYGCMSNPVYRNGPQPSFRLLSMAGKKHLELLNACLISIHQNWEVRPELLLYSDGSVSIREMQETFQWWKGPIYWGTQEDILNWTAQTGSVALMEFARKEPVGRKLACILKEGEHNGVLWCDTDILWYKPLPEPEPQEGLTLKTSTDYQAAYDAVLETAAQHILATPPFINTGLVYLKGNLINHPLAADWLNRLADAPNHFTEQTFLAILMKLLKQEVWTLEEIACLQQDRYQLAPSYPGKPWLARHYVGPVRHLFWRDAFLNRMKISK